jgi:hypothetical protein
VDLVSIDFFPDDANETLKRVQCALFSTLVVHLVAPARRRYLEAMHFVGSDTELGERLWRMTSFDPRALERAYAKIAAYFRFTCDQGGQMPFPFDGLGYEEHLTGGWRAFLEREAAELARCDGIAIAIVTAVSYDQMPKGREAEEQLDSQLDVRYRYFSPLRCPEREDAPPRDDDGESLRVLLDGQ